MDSLLLFLNVYVVMVYFENMNVIFYKKKIRKKINRLYMIEFLT